MAKFAKLGRRLIFAPGLLMNFYDFPRCVDLRKFLEGSNTFEKGQRIGGHFLDGLGRAYELEVLADTHRVETLAAIAVELRNEWGSPARPTTSLKEMFDTMRGYYPDLTLQTPMSINIVRFARGELGDLIEQEFPEALREQTEIFQRDNT